jgi:hypothetical protein
VPLASVNSSLNNKLIQNTTEREEMSTFVVDSWASSSGAAFATVPVSIDNRFTYSSDLDEPKSDIHHDFMYLM